MEIGKRIQELRKKNGLSQEDLAEKVDVARQTISKWELGETSPDLKQSKLLCEIFDISLDELTDNKNKTYKKNSNILNVILKVFVNIIFYMLFVIYVAWVIALIAFSIACIVLSFCLILNTNYSNLIPYIPYGCGVIISITLLSLSVFSICSNMWFISFLKECINSIKYYNHNNKFKFDKINFNSVTSKILIISLLTFVVFFVLSIIICMFVSESVAFWHTWNWFM